MLYLTPEFVKSELIERFEDPKRQLLADFCLDDRRPVTS